MEDSYIQFGEHKYPITLQSFGFIPQPQEPIAHLKQAWSDWRKKKPVSVSYEVELTDYGKAVMQEYLASGRCQVTIGYTVRAPIKVVSRFYRDRPRHTRVQRVQAKRKMLDLSQDGLCCGLRTRKASLALRLAEQDWYHDMTAEQPLASGFERIPPRVQRKRVRDAKRFARAMGLMKRMTRPVLSEKDQALVDEASREGAIAMDMPAWYVKDSIMRILEWGKQ